LEALIADSDENEFEFEFEFEDEVVMHFTEN
jgi:hypothetical protein